MCELEHAADPVKVKPICRPQYTKALGETFEAWLEINANDVTRYYGELGAAIRNSGPNDASCTFEEFAAVQYDQQCDMDEDEPEDREVMLADFYDDDSWEDEDEWFV